MHTCIIGIDCATEPQKRGVACARFENGVCIVDETATGLTDSQIADLVINCKEQFKNVLLALDAPLGWPEGLGIGLVGHHAGQHLPGSANNLFRRETDRFIKKRFNKQPLDVGADRIARTAHSALRLLAEISKSLGSVIPLAWSNTFSDVVAIEVYPAATLLAYGLPAGGYKKQADRAIRQSIINGLQEYLSVPNIEPLLLNADTLDAVLCVLAATDFIVESTYPPIDKELARKEGWIWVKTRSENGVD
ncbi:DUF429 domain-containing protein [Geopsychrobacter electrodiphilus]|uniref:DUF429 domain-containing protein n=1 Tax=Geopsychrobacter electrodiphilus TaxID=225196 RepID=UPI00037CB69C|nr:DUF429 domain-containing protein [Geopsychrobacter electrodiphilus]